MHATFLERAMKLLCFQSAAMLLSLISATTWSATATIKPSQDNTLAEELPDNSSGACDSIFSGMTDNNDARRALLQFDIAAAIPPGSTINSVTLSMAVTRGSNHPDAIMSLHPLNQTWGEGSNGCGVRGGGQGEPAVTGSATWLSALHSQAPAWTLAGGD